MSDVESYLILKYGSLSGAYHMWINIPQLKSGMNDAESDIINEFFSVKSLRERMARLGTDHVRR